jgi:hypothetical protein
MTDDRRPDLDALLREPIDVLAPPDGLWDSIGHRAKRRKWAKAGAAVAAGVVVAAGAVPAVIAVRHSAADDSRVGVADGHGGKAPTHVPTPIAPPVASIGSLAGFEPESVSFVSQAHGYLWGSLGTSRRGVLAETTDGGQTWARRPAPAVNDGYVARHGDTQVRFATTESGGVGFVYGEKYFVTRDDGDSWTQLPSHGDIVALETRRGSVWALVRPCAHCSAVRLYGATTTDPLLRRVPGVPVMHGAPGTATFSGAASLAVSLTPVGQQYIERVAVIAGDHDLWLSPNGHKWVRGSNPCGRGVRSALITISGAADVVAACGSRLRQSRERKQTFVSSNGGKRWKPTKGSPAPAGYLQTMAAGTTLSTIVGTSRGGAYLTHNAGKTWTAVHAQRQKLSFVGYIDTLHIVGVVGRDSGVGGFAASTDGGKTWAVHEFAATG